MMWSLDVGVKAAKMANVHPPEIPIVTGSSRDEIGTLAVLPAPCTDKLLEEAKAICLDGLARNPEWLELVRLLGALAARTHQDAIARACMERVRVEFGDEALSTPATDLSTYHRIAVSRINTRDYDGALEMLRAGLQRVGGSPADRAALFVAIGQALARTGAHQQAIEAFRDALALEPTGFDPLRHLICLFEFFGANGDAARAWLHLGIALDAHDRFDEAAIAYRRSLVHEPRGLDALVRLGIDQMAVGDPAGAVETFRSALRIEPARVATHIHLARALHQSGCDEAGWRELRWTCDPAVIKNWRAFEQPLWDGSPLAGKRVLLWAMHDYGLGDTIQLTRFAPILKARGASYVALECQRALVPLIASMPAVDRVVGRSAPLPPFDVHAPLIVVPIVDRASRANLAASVPYLSADEGMTDRWRERLGAFQGRSIGLCWATQSLRPDAKRRSAPLAAFASLARSADVRVVSLQRGFPAVEAFVPPSGLTVETVLSPSASIAQTAALIRALDLVITVDTMVAHLAGALGRPVWTLLPYDADWKWHDGPRPNETPWYPTMRLFRQRRAGDWADVLERVQAALVVWSRETPEVDVAHREGTRRGIEE